MNGGVLFDMDGVLVDSGPAHHESWQVLAERHGLSVSAEAFNRTFGRPSRDIIRLLWGEDVSDDDIRRIDEDKEAVYREIVAENVPLMPGCREMLAGLKEAGFVLAVATSGPPENLELVLDRGGLREFFSATVNGFEVSNGKPAPDCFLLAAERIQKSPGECVVVEDAPVGVQAGLAAGMAVIALVGTHPAKPLSATGATCTLERLADITPVLVQGLLSPKK